MSLADVQQIFWRHLQGEAAPLEPFRGTAELGSAERIAIYAHMVLHRQIDVLRSTFPKLTAAVGEEEFHALAARYARTLPSQRPDLGQLGQGFVELVGRADLRDLARLEWARDESFSSAPEEALAPEELARLASDPAAFMVRRVRLVPSVRLLRLRHDVAALWDGTAQSAAAAITHVVVWRSGFDVFHAPVPEDEAGALEVARGGAALGEICGVFGSAERAAEVLQTWLGEGFLASA